MATQELGGGSLLIAWQLKNKRVLIVGGGQVASGRIESILVADANIILISPKDGLTSRTKLLLEEYPTRITYKNRVFLGPEDLVGIDMVLTAIDDVEKSREIYQLSREAKIPINVADIPDACDFYFGSQVRDGPLQIMISTNGDSPRMAAMIRQRIERCLGGYEGEAVKKAGALRSKLKERAPGVGGKVGKKRMRWMIDICNAWEMEDFTVLDDELIKRLLDEGWEKNRVPKLADIGGSRDKPTIAASPATFVPYAVGAIVGAIGCAFAYRR
ncbi:siroheme synthase [Pleurotus eryngii]|uniref:precorrin-2 dehydrogenase n=1 Tax=Pleurotus eryngii TaxID=5323 RepID=A0A9P6DJ68_PLEER|nr:siroheme synthase [Pleurotus eryngii]